MSETKIAYEPHPVTAERVAELQAQGFQIVDEVFKPADAPQEEPANEPEQADKPRRGRPPIAKEPE
jgi:hypothetical protein